MTVADTLTEAIAAAQAGNRDEARAALIRVLEADERNELAWLWLSGVMDTPEERRICLENVLTINPANSHALHGLKLLNQQHPPAASPPPAAAPAPQPAVEPATGPTVKLSAPEADPAPLLAEDAQAEEPCPYCGAVTLQRHRSCPACYKSLMVRTAPRAQRSLALTIIAWMYVLSCVGTVLGGGFLIVTAVAAATVASAVGQELPAEFVGVIVGGVLILLILIISMTVGLFRRRRWAYITHIVSLVFSALMTVAQVVFAGVFASFLLALSSQASDPAEQAEMVNAAGSVGGSIFCNVLILVVWIALTVLSYRDFYGPMARMTTAGLSGNADAYNMGIRFRDAGMWYMAAHSWERAARQAPRDAEVRYALGLAYARLKRFDQSIIALRAALELQPGNTQLAADLASVERLASRKH